MSVVVIDYGMGNIRSVAKAVEHAAGPVQVFISSNAEEICAADHVILPGVGALADCMSELQQRELHEAVIECIRSRPFLGICLGMQLLLDKSEENGGTQALGLIAGQSVHFPLVPCQSQGLKIPHMGWNEVQQRQAHPLWQGIAQNSRFYFVHSYYVVPTQNQVVMATSEYSVNFASAIGRDNIFAVQFHPEKSQQDGLKLLENFIAWDGSC